jgi:hypothetical protein
MKARTFPLGGILALAALAAGACTKPEEKPPVKQDPADIPTFKIVGTPPAPSASASTAAPETPSASAAPSAPTSAPSATAAKSAGSGAPPPLSALKPASTKIAGKNFALDVASPGCRVDESCAMTIRLSVLGDYHVNKGYPYKFVAAAAPSVTYLADGNTFSRSTGDFKEEGEKAATMTVRFKPAAAGEAKISGTFKMSVCSAENCQIEQQAVTLSVPVN